VAEGGWGILKTGSLVGDQIDGGGGGGGILKKVRASQLSLKKNGRNQAKKRPAGKKKEHKHRVPEGGGQVETRAVKRTS